MRREKAQRMDSYWIPLGLLGWGLGFLFVMVLMRTAGKQDRAARHEEKRMDPVSDVTITKVDNPSESDK